MLKRARYKTLFVSYLFLSGFFTPAAQATLLLIDRLEASVNSSIILYSDISQFRKTQKLRSQLDPLFAENEAFADGKLTDSEIVSFLIDEQVILMNLPTGDDEVEQEIRSIETKNKINRTTLRTAIAQQGFSFHDYFELIRTSIAKKKLIDRDIRTKVFISDDDVKNYFYNHFTGNKKSLAYQIKIITVSPSRFSAPEDAYDEAKKAEEALKSGQSFEEVAKKYSDSASASSGGDLGTFTEDEMSPAIRQEVKKLKLGEVSTLLGSKNTNYFILKIADIKTGQEGEFNRIKEEIRNKLATVEYRRQISLWIERKRQDAFIHIANK